MRRVKDGKTKQGGYFTDELEAAKESDRILKEIGGRGKLNFPDPESDESDRKKEVKNPRKRKISTPEKKRKRQRRTAHVIITLVKCNEFF